MDEATSDRSEAPAREPDETSHEAPLAGPGAAIDARTARHDIVVVGASAGGVAALKKLFAALPAGYAGSVFVVMHVSAESQATLAGILARAGSLRTVQAEDGLAIEAGCAYVAPPDRHLLVEPGTLRVVRGPRENRHRPAIDPLFRSAAWAYGPRVVGVVLTGWLDDGTAGLWAVKSCGGVTVVQEPAEAEHPEMPSNALTHTTVDHRLPLEDIAALLARGVERPPQAAGPRPQRIADEIEAVRFGSSIETMQRLGSLSPFTCPTCHGALWEMDEDGHLRYRCHTGHAFTLPTLMTEQDEVVEHSLYAALRALEEKSRALRHLAERWGQRMPGVRKDYEQRALDIEAAAVVLRRMLAAGAAARTSSA